MRNRPKDISGAFNPLKIGVVFPHPRDPQKTVVQSLMVHNNNTFKKLALQGMLLKAPAMWHCMQVAQMKLERVIRLCFDPSSIS